MKELKLDLSEDQIFELKRFVERNNYEWDEKKAKIPRKRFGLFADANIQTGILKIALVNAKQFEIIQNAIIEARKIGEEA